MNTKTKIIGIIIVLSSIMYVRGIDYLPNLYNHKPIYTNTISTKIIKKGKANKSNNLILVNKENPIDSTYKPENLTKPNIRFLSSTSEESRYLSEEAANALEDLFKSAQGEGVTLIGSSAYRSYESQVNVLNEETRKKGNEYANNYVAKPGKSEHQTGLAIDITNEARCFDENSLEARWIKDNAYKFGFILRYPKEKENTTGYSYEPWHIRYVGKEASKIIYERGLTLEEYLAS